jgi:hypothetical protein
MMNFRYQAVTKGRSDWAKLTGAFLQLFVEKAPKSVSSNTPSIRATHPPPHFEEVCD